MIAYTTLGTNDLARSAAFYDALLGDLGAKRAMEIDRVILWAAGAGQPLFAVAEPADGAPATVGNGTMVALSASDPAMVDKLHAKALALGAQDDGAPGPRTNQGLKFYAGYFRDPDGNKLNFFCLQ
ncbi:MAG: VOC family protein [Rhodothalassiaceae bacterium]